jgi:hypothetical protein
MSIPLTPHHHPHETIPTIPPIRRLDKARQIITFGDPHSIQVGIIDVSRNPIKIIYREAKRAALDPIAEHSAAPLDLNAMIPALPFIARCGNIIVQVRRVFTELLPLPMFRAEILAGQHFNDAGDYGPGDTVNFGPLTEHWEVLTFPDIPPA